MGIDILDGPFQFDAKLTLHRIDGTAVLPARPYKPKDKAKAERRIGRSYLSPEVRCGMPVGPPFKPCVRFSRTRLTGSLSNVCITHSPRRGYPDSE